MNKRRYRVATENYVIATVDLDLAISKIIDNVKPSCPTSARRELQDYLVEKIADLESYEGFSYHSVNVEVY